MRGACPHCRDHLTALVDGELGALADAWLRLHLRRNPPCAAAADELRRAVQLQTALLAAPAGVAGDDLLAGLRRSIAALGTPAPAAEAAPVAAVPSWPRPLLAGLAAAAALVVVAAGLGGRGAERVLVPLGLEDPPAAVAKKPELFHEYDLIRELEALENFDAVNRVRLGKKKPKTEPARET